MNERRDDLREIMDKALEGMAAEAGEGFDPQVNITHQSVHDSTHHRCVVP